MAAIVHAVIDEAIGPEGVEIENNAKVAIALLKLTGLVAVAAGAILMVSSIASALWISAALGLASVIIGHDVYLLSNNAENKLRSIAGRLSLINNYNNEKYYALFNSISTGTVIKMLYTDRVHDAFKVTITGRYDL